MPISTLHLLLRVSARASGTVFLVAFASPGLAAISQSEPSRWCKGAANWLLLLFVFLHTIHLAFIVWLASILGPQFFQKPAALIPGTMVYLCIYGLAFSLLNQHRQIRLVSSESFRSLMLFIVWAAFTLAFTASVARYPSVLPLAVISYLSLLARVAGRLSLSRRSLRRA